MRRTIALLLACSLTFQATAGIIVFPTMRAPIIIVTPAVQPKSPAPAASAAPTPASATSSAPTRSNSFNGSAVTPRCPHTDKTAACEKERAR